MKLSIYSYNGTPINDGSSYYAVFDSDGAFGQAETSVVEVARHQNTPAMVDVAFAGRQFEIEITMLGTLHDQIATLNALFDAQDTSYRTLIVKDTANSDKQWYLSCKCVRSYMKDIATYVAVMKCSDPVKKAVDTTAAATINITSSGGTGTASPGGTLSVEPIIDITPRAAKTGGLAHRRFARVYNPLAVAQVNYGLEITGGGLDTAALVADTSKSNQINQGGGINASVTTFPIDTAVGGGLPAVGMGYVDTEQIRWTGNSGTQLTGVTRGVGGTTAASHADNAVIKRSKMLANGDDVTVFVDGVIVPRWFGTGSNAMNQAATKIWIVANWNAKRELTIEAATDSQTTITFQNTSANVKALHTLPTAGTALLESEIITWTGKTEASRQITGVTRAAKFTSAAAHAAGVTLRWIEHDIMLAYGDHNAVTPTVDDTRKPIFALTSTNTSWVYSGAFRTVTGLRAGEWVPVYIASLCKDPNARQTRFYGADYSTAGGPTMPTDGIVTEMGMRVATFLRGTVNQSENGQVAWQLAHPAGMSEITATGEKYRTSTSWRNFAGLQRSGDNGKNWTDVWDEATPASTSVWANWDSHSAVALTGNPTLIRLLMAGDVPAGYEADSECDAATITLVSASVPQVSLGSENSSYDLDCVITNTTANPDEWIKIRKQIELDQTLRVNCATRELTYLKDNSKCYSALVGRSSKRDYFLKLASGSNTIQYDETGVTDIDLDISWQDRQN